VATGKALTEILISCSSLPNALETSMVISKFPVAVVVPLIIPVVLLSVRPVGKAPSAMVNDVGAFIASTSNVNAWPEGTMKLSSLDITGGYPAGSSGSSGVLGAPPDSQARDISIK
jgi:hypothetical protein